MEETRERMNIISKQSLTDAQSQIRWRVWLRLYGPLGVNRNNKKLEVINVV